MIYLVGGPPRTGKSILANVGLKKYHIPYCSTDVLIHMIKKAAPKSGVTDRVGYFEKCQRFLVFLDNFLKIARYDNNNYLIEGDAISPESVLVMNKKYKLKSVFLINTDPDLKKIVDNTGDNDWLVDKDADYQKAVVASIKRNSMVIKKQCQEMGLTFFDVRDSFDGRIKKAASCLFD